MPENPRGAAGQTEADALAAVRAERARRAGRLDEAIAIARADAGDLRARVALAVALLERGDAGAARGELVEALEGWAARAGVALTAAVSDDDEAPTPLAPIPVEADEIHAIDEGEWDAALDSAVPVVDQMHDANRVAERVLMDEPEGLSEIGWSGDEIGFSERAAEASAIDAAEVPAQEVAGTSAERGRGRVLATLESWLANVRREQAQADR